MFENEKEDPKKLEFLDIGLLEQYLVVDPNLKCLEKNNVQEHCEDLVSLKVVEEKHLNEDVLIESSRDSFQNGSAIVIPKRKYLMKNRRPAAVFYCKVCNLTIKYPSKIIEHLRVHTGERPFECFQCSATFTQSGALTAHIRSHYGLRLFECRFCCRKFTTSGQRRVHERMCTVHAFAMCSDCVNYKNVPSSSNYNKNLPNETFDYGSGRIYRHHDFAYQSGVFRNNEETEIDSYKPVEYSQSVFPFCFAERGKPVIYSKYGQTADISNTIDESMQDKTHFQNCIDKNVEHSFAEYVPVKTNLFANETDPTTMIFNLDDCKTKRGENLLLVPPSFLADRNYRIVKTTKKLSNKLKLKEDEMVYNVDFNNDRCHVDKFKNFIVENEPEGDQFCFVLQSDDELENDEENFFHNDVESSKFDEKAIKYVEANVQPPSKGRKRHNANEEKIYVVSELFKYALPQVVSRRSKYAVVPIDLQPQYEQKYENAWVRLSSCYHSTLTEAFVNPEKLSAKICFPTQPTNNAELPAAIFRADSVLTQKKRHVNCVINSIVKKDESERRLNEVTKTSYPRRLATFHKCEYCGRVLKYPSKIEAHMRTHTQERPFKCLICGLGFAQNTTLRMHLRRHLNHKPFECPYQDCDYKFINGGLLNAHIQKRHVQQLNGFACLFGCGVILNSDKERKKHEKLYCETKKFTKNDYKVSEDLKNDDFLDANKVQLEMGFCRYRKNDSFAKIEQHENNVIVRPTGLMSSYYSYI